MELAPTANSKSDQNEWPVTQKKENTSMVRFLSVPRIFLNGIAGISNPYWKHIVTFVQNEGQRFAGIIFLYLVDTELDT